MTDLSQVPDDELLAMYAMPALIKQESGGRAGVLGPQTRYGRAEGLTQMLPATAQAMAAKVGVPWRPELMRGDTPEAAEYQERLGQAYLQEGIQKTGSLPEAFKYYHGGPDTRQWGPKTNAYAQQVSARLGMNEPAPDLSALSDDELMAMYQATEAPVQVAATTPAAPPRKAAPRPPQALPQRQGPTIAQDAASGFLQPFKDLGATVSARMDAPRAPPTSVGDFLRGAFVDPVVETGQLLGGVAGLASAPIQAAVRPIARGINRVAPPMYEKGPSILSPEFWDDKPDIPRRLDEPGRQAAIEGSINTALSAAKPATPKAPPAPRGPRNAADLKKARTQAYQEVRDMGVAYSPKAGATLADNLGYELAAERINPKVTPKAHAVMEDLQDQLRSGQPITLDRLDDMRKQVDRATGRADDAEQFFGARMRELIDDFIDNAGPEAVINGNGPAAREALLRARQLNSQYRKLEAVENAMESADLRAASTYAGGNKANAARQNIRPLIDPTSSKRIRNLSGPEKAAARKVVDGTGGANAARQVGKLLDPRGLLGQVALGPLGIPTAGITPTIGAVASEVSNLYTARALKELSDLIARGGGAAKLPQKLPILQLAGKPPVRLRSVPGVVGAGTIAAPAARKPSSQAAKAPARTAPPKKRQTQR